MNRLPVGAGEAWSGVGTLVVARAALGCSLPDQHLAPPRRGRPQGSPPFSAPPPPLRIPPPLVCLFPTLLFPPPEVDAYEGRSIGHVRDQSAPTGGWMILFLCIIGGGRGEPDPTVGISNIVIWEELLLYFAAALLYYVVSKRLTVS